MKRSSHCSSCDETTDPAAAYWSAADTSPVRWRLDSAAEDAMVVAPEAPEPPATLSLTSEASSCLRL